MFKNIGVKNGVFLGIASVIYTHITYMINPMNIFNYVAYLAFVITIFFMYKSAKEERTANEGILSFGDALKVTFLTYVVGGIFGAIHVYLLFNVIDPSLTDVAKEFQLQVAESMASFMGAEEALEDLPDQLDQQDMQMSFGMVFINYLVSLIFPGFIFALIISAITKKEAS